MKKIKCILAVVLGTILGLFSSCSPREEPPQKQGEPEKEQTEVQTREGKQTEVPKKEEDLPVRRPILE
jgi:PBP1b-binding outer membrane lipoprotein LpoB